MCCRTIWRDVTAAVGSLIIGSRHTGVGTARRRNREEWRHSTSPHIPPNTRCVAESIWREACYAGGVTNSDKTDPKRKAFKRASEELSKAGRIGNLGDLVWIIA
jgi:hypothetical protein